MRGALLRILRLSVILTSLVALMLAAIWIAYALPDKRIQRNVSESYEFLRKEGVYPLPYGYLGPRVGQLHGCPDA